MADSREYFAPCTLGLEEVLAEEIRGLAAAGSPIDAEIRRGGVAFRGDRRLGYAANLWLRSAVRVQEKLFEGDARGREELYAAVHALEWERYLDLNQTLAVDASVRDSAITHSNFAALTVKDAIVDRFRRRTGARPSVNVDDPDLPLKLVLARDRATLYLNLSGESLHKRGWRPIQVKSPLNEAIAAGLLLLSGWDRKSPLVDPMCGSGTFLIEAASLAADRAPGLQRRFAFERWPEFDAKLWQSLRDDAQRRAKLALPFSIEGADHHAGALGIARKSVRAAGAEGLVKLTQAEVKSFAPTAPPKFVVTNPPWGERLGEDEEVVRAWQELGNFLHEQCRGAVAYVLSGNPELPRFLGLRTSRKHPLMNGPIECRWLRYEVFAEVKSPPPEP